MTILSEALSNRLHAVFIEATREVRERFGAADIGRFEFSIKASGRTLTDADEVKIEYRMCANFESDVKGNDMERCIKEVLRRHGWQETNAPLSLPQSLVISNS